MKDEDGGHTICRTSTKLMFPICLSIDTNAYPVPIVPCDDREASFWHHCSIDTTCLIMMV